MKLILIILFGCSVILSQKNSGNIPELLRTNEVTDHSTMLKFLFALKSITPGMQVDTSAHTVQGRCIPYISFIKPGKSTNLRVLFFAQQHGDEPSGKEGMLMLINELATGSLKSLLKSLDVIIVPQMNPDGAAVCKRRNGNNMDLNRNHLILTEHETQALHKVYHSFKPHVTVDFHEYSPFSEYWKGYGAIKHTDEQIGVLTNPNIPEKMRNFQNDVAVPEFIKVISAAGYTSSHYIVGGPPEIERMRYSTTHINDGRQGLGSFGSLSFIIEGKNGKNCTDNLKFRSTGQFTAAKAVLEFSLKYRKTISQLVQQIKEELNKPHSGLALTTVHEHIANGDKLTVRLLSLKTGADTLATVNSWHPSIENLAVVKAPSGYLIPKSEIALLKMLENHTVILTPFIPQKTGKVFQYSIEKIDTITVEEDPFARATVNSSEVSISEGEYVLASMKGTVQRYLVQALEPLSLYGIHQYPAYSYLLQAKSKYPILRLEK